MAYSNRKKDLFTGLRKPRGKDRFSPIETRSEYGPDLDQTGYGSPPSEEYGQGQFGPGWQSAQTSRIDWLTDLYGSFYGAQNMNDLYDMWENQYGAFATGEAQSQYDSFYEWWQNYGHEGTYSPGEATAYPGWEMGGNSVGGYMNPQESSGFGGSQGGAGDLGTGSYFAGGGMGSSLYGGGGITNPWGEGWGPSGQVGGPNELDPDWNEYGDECLSMWQTFQSQDWASGSYDSYDDFAADYCG